MDDYTIIALSMCCGAFLFYVLSFWIAREVPILKRDVINQSTGQIVPNGEIVTDPYTNKPIEDTHSWLYVGKCGCYILTIMCLIVGFVMTGIMNKIPGQSKGGHTDINAGDIAAYVIIGLAIIILITSGCFWAFPSDIGWAYAYCAAEGRDLAAPFKTPTKTHYITQFISLLMIGVAIVLLMIQDL
jgi:hypothetical protein